MLYKDCCSFHHVSNVLCSSWRSSNSNLRMNRGRDISLRARVTVAGPWAVDLCWLFNLSWLLCLANAGWPLIPSQKLGFGVIACPTEMLFWMVTVEVACYVPYNDEVPSCVTHLSLGLSIAATSIDFFITFMYSECYKLDIHHFWYKVQKLPRHTWHCGFQGKYVLNVLYENNEILINLVLLFKTAIT